jgi:ribosomal protein L29
MKTTDFVTEIKEMGVEALRTRAQEIREELVKNRFRKVSGQVKVTHLASVLKRNLARVLTVIKEKAK